MFCQSQPCFILSCRFCDGYMKPPTRVFQTLCLCSVEERKGCAVLILHGIMTVFMSKTHLSASSTLWGTDVHLRYTLSLLVKIEIACNDTPTQSWQSSIWALVITLLVKSCVLWVFSLVLLFLTTSEDVWHLSRLAPEQLFGVSESWLLNLLTCNGESLS